MNFQHLKYFLMVAEELNITRAAERLYISQQSLSNHISNMERELDVKLFTRSPKLSLTYAGELLVSTATQILDQYSQYLSKVGDINRQYLGVLRVGISHTCGLALLPDVLPKFRQEFPIVSLLFSFIYVFHMEAFVFLSGYHSKNVEKCRETAFERFFVPYVLVNFLTYAWIALIKGSKFSITGFQLFMPHSTLWFLFALFVWRLLLKDLARIRLVLPLSILAGLGSGIFDSLGIYYSLTRIFSFVMLNVSEASLT